MTTEAKGPKRRRVALPPMERFPRVGKIRLGEQVPTKSGASLRPSKLDYFRVEAEESGVTSAESAASFHEVYGEQPRTLRCVLPGPTPESVFEGAFRLYGQSKLKRLCDGTTCDERTATGGWTEHPCICNARAYPGDHKDRCKLTWSLQVLLPDVQGVGVWQIDTGSEISVRRVSAWLRMMHTLQGDLSLTEFHLDLVETKVAPEGKATSVYVLQPRTADLTPRQMLEGAGRVERLEIDAGEVLPVIPEPLIEEAIDDEPVVDEETGEVLDPEVVEAPVADVNVVKERIETLRLYGLSDEQIKTAGKTAGVETWEQIMDDEVWERTKEAGWKLAEEQRKTIPEEDVTF